MEQYLIRNSLKNNANPKHLHTTAIIDLQNLENGIYIIKFTNESKELVQHAKLIVNK